MFGKKNTGFYLHSSSSCRKPYWACYRSSNTGFCGTKTRASLVKCGFLWNEDSCIARQIRFSVEQRLVHRSSNAVFCGTKTRASLVKYGFLQNEDSCIARQIWFSVERRFVHRSSNTVLCRTKTRANKIT